MAERSSSPHPTQRRYPPELRERAVRMVREVATEQGERHGANTRVARTSASDPSRSACGSAKPRSTRAIGPASQHTSAPA